jgi:hypothetical protein
MDRRFSAAALPPAQAGSGNANPSHSYVDFFYTENRGYFAAGLKEEALLYYGRTTSEAASLPPGY